VTKTGTLGKYKDKRNFNITSEPEGHTPPQIPAHTHRLVFVVQHHLSKRPHYDLRLEWNGVLLSWAVPKGPSLDPNDKRLAVHVEDHPLEYRHFEGTIPQGQYGAGSVTIWDKGYWEPIGTPAHNILDTRSLKFILYGEKLKGNWTLVNTLKENHWLLIKE
jgi:bifunctional non-homologous end joining protein LigD